MENTHRLVNSIEIHMKFSRTPKIIKLGPKFIIFLLNIVSSLVPLFITCGYG
jgi:hypothetical protein